MQRQAAATETAANAAKKSAEVAEMALRLGERADVLLNAVALTNDPEVLSSNIPINPHCRVNMEFKNFGRTRAQNVRCLIGLIIPGVRKLGRQWTTTNGLRGYSRHAATVVMVTGRRPRFATVMMHSV